MGEYKRKFEFSADELSSQGIMRADRLLYHFQEIASGHVASEGFGIEDIKKDNCIWVLSKLKYRLYESLSTDEEYVISTCQRKKRAVTYFRDYFIYGEDGRVVLEGTSQWCVLNFVTRKVEKVDFGVENVDHNSEYINEGFPKIRIDEVSPAGTHVVEEFDLDGNMHTNNCRYAEFVGDITGDCYYRDFVIYFNKETMRGDEILFYSEKKEEITIAEGRLEDYTMVFQAKMKA
ncbi:MAG: hypothetical protein GX663_00765 [Clostridiales bacterium]|nr:hypothetical protein [Clostridiales bacterium]